MNDEKGKQPDNNFEDILKRVDTEEPEEMRNIWEGFTLDKNKVKKEDE